MKREYRTVPSKNFGRPMEMLVYGTSGKPMIVFPSQEGRFFDYENFGMIDTLAPFIEEGKIQVYCVDSLDHESWFSQADPAYRASRANDYDLAISQDIIPHIQNDGHEGAGVMVHGCSFGAFHTANEFLKNPELIDCGIALSGCYSIEFTMPDFVNDHVYFNDPARYSAGLKDSNCAAKFAESLLIVCSGQGAWEEWIDEATDLCQNLHEADIPVILDLWGYDVSHDWPWWKKMIVYFLGKLDRAGCLKSNHRLSRKEVQRFLTDFHSI